MTRDQLISIFFIGLLIFVVWEIFRIFAPFFEPLFWAAILSFAFYPVYERIRKSLRNHDSTAALIVTALVFLCVVPPLAFLVANITAQAIDLYQAVSDYIRSGRLEKTIDYVRSLSLIQRIEANLFQWEPLKENMTAWFLNSSKAIANFAVSQVGTITKNIFFVILNILIITFLVFVFLKDGAKIYQFIYDIAPLEKATKKSIFHQINETFSAVIRGQLTTSLIQAATAGVLFWLCGIPAPIFFAAATFITTLIPVIGAAGIWVPLAIYLLVIQSYVKGIILTVFGVLVISLIDNIVKPALIGEKTKLPYFLLFFGILGGMKLYGFTGIFLAPVVLSLFFALIKIYQEKYAN
ncbi:MAG: AI-2E family transporter [Candidatus Omnitrophica bacterium]|nr:AI-2E family transporter [Candidatus Omnitrophota bacterium]